ncbi:MAG: 2-phosphosulfolactate phosphatase [Candidatus Bathyarchaeia archaeon]
MVINVDVEFLARDAARAARRGDLVIVIDVLRCSSTIVTALANGAKAIIPVKTLKEARRERLNKPDYILAGERGGLKPRGFDLGNSPLEYTSERISGKVIVLTTTSGTRALIYSRGARWILVGSLLNAEAVAKAAYSIARSEDIGVTIVQSGTNGRFSLEDFICAGAIVSKLPEGNIKLSDSAQASLLAFRYAKNNLRAILMESAHSRRLIDLGFSRDIEFSCQMDYFRVVPIYDGNVIVRGDFRAGLEGT